MHNLKDLEDYIKKTEDMQLSMMVEIVKEYGNEIPALIKSLKDKHVGDDEKEKAEMIFSTVHRAKGMEYDEVTLVEDFITETGLERMVKESENNEANRAKWNEEINLLYVAVTRAKSILNIPAALVPKNFVAVSGINIIDGEDEDEQLITPNSKPPANAKRTSGKKQGEEVSFTYLEKRLKNKNAYERWSPEKDEELRIMYYKGIKINSLTEHFGRNKGAILSRLKKIGCIHFD